MEAEAIGIGTARISLGEGRKIYAQGMVAAYTAMPTAVA